MLPHLLFALVASTAFAAPHTSSSSSTSNNQKHRGAYSLTTSYAGSTFFDNFSFYTGPDPTNGFVNYTSRSVAASSGLVGFIHNLTSETVTAYIGVDHTTTIPLVEGGPGRNSVRLIGNKKFNAGSMAVIDVRHIPVQNGVWPAIWMLGSSDVAIWPKAGESDILEYVHTAEANAVTLHTAPNFYVDNTTEAFQGTLVDNNCNAVDATKGCSITMEHTTTKKNATIATAGKAFNAQGGGVYVHDWTSEGITVWLFPHNDLPADLLAGHPDSSTWTDRKPLAKFTSAEGDFGKAFRDMQLIINIDFCGDWAGKDAVWKSSGAMKATGQKTCKEYVGANPEDFKETYFEIGGIDFYSKDGAAETETPEYNGTTTAAAPSKRDVEGEHAGIEKHHHHHRAHSHSHSDFEAPPPIIERSAKTSDASATEVVGWLVAAGMFCVVAALL